MAQSQRKCDGYWRQSVQTFKGHRLHTVQPLRCCLIKQWPAWQDTHIDFIHQRLISVGYAPWWLVTKSSDVEQTKVWLKSDMFSCRNRREKMRTCKQRLVSNSHHPSAPLMFWRILKNLKIEEVCGPSHGQGTEGNVDIQFCKVSLRYISFLAKTC